MVKSNFKHLSKNNKESTGFFQKIKKIFTGSNLRLRVTSAVFMIALAVYMFYIGFFAVCPVVIALAVAMIYEYDRMFIAPLPSDPNIGGRVPSGESLRYFYKKFAFDAISIIGLLSLFCFNFATKRFGTPYLIVYYLAVFAISLLFSFIGKRKHWILESLPVVYIGLGIWGLLNIYFSFDWVVVLLFFIITISTDSGAYFIGRIIGGPKLCPRISPKKTWAGFFGGIIFACIFASLYIYIFDEKFLFTLSFLELAFILILSILAQIGDLFESWLKRTAGVKDSSQLIPGHGGFLDRFDSILFIFDILVLIEFFYFLGYAFSFFMLGM